MVFYVSHIVVNHYGAKASSVAPVSQNGTTANESRAIGRWVSLPLAHCLTNFQNGETVFIS